jgi:cytochrome c-type biogenesis protein CcmH
MIFALMLGLAIVLMVPLLFIFRGGVTVARGRRDAAIAIHRAQLEELSRDLANGRIAEGEYAGAKLEIERRLLAADTLTDVKFDGSAKWFLALVALAVPAMAFLLYLPGSTPHVPSVPHAEVAAQQQKAAAQVDTLIAQLRAHLAAIDPNSADASEGQALLAEALAERAGALTPESIALFKQSLVNAPPNASWRNLAEQRLVQASVTQ